MISRQFSIKTRTSVRFVSTVLSLVAVPGLVHAQAPVDGHAVIIAAPDNRAGPRFGVAVLTRGSETARQENKPFSPVTSLFGWQIEHPFDIGPEMPTLVTELVVLVGGLEQNVFLPSATWLIGMRQTNGLEFGVGPTVTATGTQIAFAGGITQKFGNVNVPLNLAIAPSRVGVALSITAGFNVRRD
jgi:hypothetical protein